MKRTLLVVVLLVFAILSIASAKPRPKKHPCKPDLASCPLEGCGGSFDPNLNKRKNISSDSQTPIVKTLAEMKALADPQNFTMGGSRAELTTLGEGQQVAVV